MTCERCEFIEAEYVRAEAEDLTRDALVLALAAARVERNRLREALAAVDHSYQTGSVLPAWVLQTLAEHHARILATWPERGSRDHGSN
jgi:hypothetical protein